MTEPSDEYETWIETEEIPSVGRTWMWATFGIAVALGPLLPLLGLFR